MVPADLHVNLLGPLEVSRGTSPVRVPAGGPSVVLAVLAMTGGPVSVEALAARVWGDRLPERTRGSLHSLVLRLRRALGAQAIITTPAGYRLDIDAERVDLLRFRRLVAQARAGKDPVAIRDLLDQALRLWRGEPLMGVRAEAFERDVIPGLVEEWLEAVEQQIDMDLATRRHQDLIARLAELTSRYPLRERFWAQRMLALYGAGRQAEALDCYSAVSQRLADQLGVYPGPPLRDLHHAIVRGDPALPAPGPVEKDPGGAGRRQRLDLPTPVSALVGRRQELAAAQSLLARPEVRLLTLVGPPGVGKTRLALAVAADARARLACPAVFVDLGPLADPDLVAAAVVGVLGLPGEAGRTPVEQLIDHVGDRPLLLVLDNFEHVLPAAPLLSELLLGCSGLRLLVTSRASLRLRSEHELPVAPLPLADAMTLFVERATARIPSLALTAANREVVAEICRRLDRLPLALELAAPWLKVLEPAALLARLHSGPGVLADGARDLPGRQRTMRKTLQWSYDLLDEDERALFRRLAVFAGGFDLEAAEAVGRGTGLPGDAVLRRLSALVDRSLVVAEPGPDGSSSARYRLLEVVRQYGAERLLESDNETQLRGRHAAHFLALAESAERFERRPGQAAWLHRLESEHANLRAAMEWCQAHDTGRSVRLTIALGWFWVTRGHSNEGRQRLREVLELPTISRSDRVRALHALARLAFWQGDYRLAAQLARESAGAARDLGDRTTAGWAVNLLGSVCAYAGDAEAARAAFEEAVATDNDELRLDALIGFGESLLLQLADVAGAAAVLTQARTLAHSRDEPWQAARAALLLGLAAYLDRDYVCARHRFTESLDTFRQVGNWYGLCGALDGFAGVALTDGEPERALRLSGAAVAIRAAAGIRLPPAWERVLNGFVLEPARAGAGGAAEDAWVEGAAMTVDEAVAHALGRAGLTSDGEDPAP